MVGLALLLGQLPVLLLADADGLAVGVVQRGDEAREGLAGFVDGAQEQGAGRDGLVDAGLAIGGAELGVMPLAPLLAIVWGTARTTATATAFQ